MIARRIVAVTAVGLSVLALSGVVSTSASAAQPSKKYTSAQVAKHASAKSCWSIVNGKVYDLTSWINRHPGGASRILSMCGRDGSAGFNGQHQGQGGPTAMLKSYKIGTLR